MIVMKKIVLFSALLLAGLFAVAQAPKPACKLITIAGQGGPHGSSGGGYNGHNGNPGGHNGGAHGGYHHNGGQNMGPPMMSSMDFRMACDAIARQSFDSDKLRISEQILRGHNMSSVQVRDMARLFTFENYRVDFAKAAYLKVVDPENFYVVNDVFTFSSSISEVVAYTNSVGYAGGGTWTSSNGGSNGGGGGHGHGGGGHNHAGPCSSACGGNSGGGYGNNAYHGGGQPSGGSCGTGNGMSYHGGMNSVPVLPMCGMCSGYHEVRMVCEREFGSIANAIDNRTFESDKFLVAKQALGGKVVSADQVRRLMDLFTFESTKLDFAKWAYRITADPQNYYIVNDGFTFSSSIRELDEFIRRG